MLDDIIVLIGEEQIEQVTPINSFIGEVEGFRLRLTQDILTEEALVELEKRLNDVIVKAGVMNLEDVEAKIKMLAESIKIRYGNPTADAAPQYLGEGGGMRTGIGENICGKPED